MSEDQHFQTKRVVLQHLAIKIPNKHNVYSPNAVRPYKIVGYEEFLAKYANHPTGVRVCFDERPSPITINERSELITAYGFGLDCWYMVVGQQTRDASSQKGKS